MTEDDIGWISGTRIYLSLFKEGVDNSDLADVIAAFVYTTPVHTPILLMLIVVVHFYDFLFNLGSVWEIIAALWLVGSVFVIYPWLGYRGRN